MKVDYACRNVERGLGKQNLRRSCEPCSHEKVRQWRFILLEHFSGRGRASPRLTTSSALFGLLKSISFVRENRELILFEAFVAGDL